MQGLGLRLHRAGSGTKRRLPRRLRELTVGQMQIMGLVAFVALLCLYIVYSIRGLMAQAEARRQAEEAIGVSQPIPEPEIDDTHMGHRNFPSTADVTTVWPSGQAKGSGSRSSAPPPPVAFSGWRKRTSGGRREGAGHLQVPAADDRGFRPALASEGGSGHERSAFAGRRDPGHAVGNNAHLPIQVMERSTAGEPPRLQQINGKPAHSQPSQQAVPSREAPQTLSRKTTWLIEELQSHYTNACQASRLQPGGVPEQACKRLHQAGQTLGAEQRAEGAVSPHLIALLQGQSFGLIESIRQSLGTARPGGDVMARAVILMKELSMLAHMQYSTEEEGAKDDFLDAHVGSHIESEDGAASEGQRPPGLLKNAQKMAAGGSAQQVAQSAAANRQAGQLEAQRAHQRIEFDHVGRNSALVSGVGRAS